jgi:hypothetical protein
LAAAARGLAAAGNGAQPGLLLLVDGAPLLVLPSTLPPSVRAPALARRTGERVPCGAGALSPPAAANSTTMRAGWNTPSSPSPPGSAFIVIPPLISEMQMSLQAPKIPPPPNVMLRSKGAALRA